MADRKDRMALLSRYNKLYTQRYERKSNINLNVEQWAAEFIFNHRLGEVEERFYFGDKDESN